MGKTFKDGDRHGGFGKYRKGRMKSRDKDKKVFPKEKKSDDKYRSESFIDWDENENTSSDYVR